MSEWKEYKLSEILNLISGGTPKTSVPKYWNGNIPWLSVSDFNNGRKYVYNAEKCITQLGLDKSSTNILKKGQIIISARGTVGVISMIGKEMAFNQSNYGIDTKNDITDNHFLYYLLKNIVPVFLSNSYGAVFNTITKTTFDHIKVNLPPLPEQKAIAEVLSSLDDKIDLLHRQNKTLEHIAESIFKKMFQQPSLNPSQREGDEESKEDWEETTLYDAIDLIGGGTPKTSIDSYWNGKIKWLSGGDISTNHKSIITASEKTITEDGLNNSSTKLMPKFSTVISARGTVGKYCILSEPMAFSQSNYGIKPKYKNCFFFTYLLINHSVEELQLAAYGSVFDTITTDTFKGYSIRLPKEKVIRDFEYNIKNYFFKILNNQQQIRTLEKLRDTLLPKLMSGEVRVKL